MKPARRLQRTDADRSACMVVAADPVRPRGPDRDPAARAQPLPGPGLVPVGVPAPGAGRRGPWSSSSPGHRRCAAGRLAIVALGVLRGRRWGWVGAILISGLAWPSRSGRGGTATRRTSRWSINVVAVLLPEPARGPGDLRPGLTMTHRTSTWSPRDRRRGPGAPPPPRADPPVHPRRAVPADADRRVRRGLRPAPGPVDPRGHRRRPGRQPDARRARRGRRSAARPPPVPPVREPADERGRARPLAEPAGPPDVPGAGPAGAGRAAGPARRRGPRHVAAAAGPGAGRDRGRGRPPVRRDPRARSARSPTTAASSGPTAGWSSTTCSSTR